jgi:hypothetical protein
LPEITLTGTPSPTALRPIGAIDHHHHTAHARFQQRKQVLVEIEVAAPKLVLLRQSTISWV